MSASGQSSGCRWQDYGARSGSARDAESGSGSRRPKTVSHLGGPGGPSQGQSSHSQSQPSRSTTSPAGRFRATGRAQHGLPLALDSTIGPRDIAVKAVGFPILQQRDTVHELSAKVGQIYRTEADLLTAFGCCGRDQLAEELAGSATVTLRFSVTASASRPWIRGRGRIGLCTLFVNMTSSPRS